MRYIFECNVENVRNDLTKRDGNNVQGDQTTPNCGGRQLANVQTMRQRVRLRMRDKDRCNLRNDESSETNSETEDESTDSHDPVGAGAERDGLHYCEEQADEQNEISHEDSV